MKIIFKTLSFMVLLFPFSGCGRTFHAEAPTAPFKEPAEVQISRPPDSSGGLNTYQLLQTLDELAELERSGLWQQGMALTESGIRETAGDYAGAVAAAYKELAHGYGRGLVQKDEIEQGLSNLLEIKNEEFVVLAAGAVLSFFRELWSEASRALTFLFKEPEAPDSFENWMMLVCALEIDPQDRSAASSYKSIRARYSQFPEYWYRGARAFSGNIASDFAENCINLSPEGPFAPECRAIIAYHAGLKTEDGPSIKTKNEIDDVILLSINGNNPFFLDELMPLIGLPENPYTVYTVNSLRSLAAIPDFREYFAAKASVSSGRLSERLLYISRG